MPHRLVLALSLAFTFAAAPTWSATLELKRVMLSSGGVGYFEYETQVTGDQTVELDVRLDQVDDVLKSIVVFDSLGTVGSISLPGREPLAQLTKDLPFEASAFNSVAEMLNALKGAELQVGAPKPLAGRILSAEREALADGAGRTRVSLITADGLQQFVLEDTSAVKFTDPALQAKLSDTLAAISGYRGGGRRTLSLQARGTGTRTLRVGYVAVAPLWKASYRVALPKDSTTDKARVQGWAVFENQTGQDWRDVELTLLSGNPVTFHQAIYQSYYVDRPEVPVEVLGRILPRVDGGSVAVPQAMMRREAALPPPAPAPMMAASAAPASAPLGKFADAADTATTIASASQVNYKLPRPISLTAGRSAVVPIVDRDLPVRRVSLLQAGDDKLLAAAELRNDTDAGLPPGVITAYEQLADGSIAYVGDARLAPLPAGEDRLMSFATDSKVKLVQTRNLTTAVAGATVSSGVLQVNRKQRQTVAYRIAAPPGEARRVILEQARLVNWSIVELAANGVRMTPNAWRIEASLAPGEEKTVTFTLEQPLSETFRLLDANDQQLGLLVSTQELPAGLRDALRDLTRRRKTLADRRADLERLQKERDALATDQARVRENLGAVAKGTPLYDRLADKLAQEETSLDGLAGSLKTAQGEVDKATTAVAEFIAGMRF